MSDLCDLYVTVYSIDPEELHRINPKVNTDSMDTYLPTFDYSYQNLAFSKGTMHLRGAKEQFFNVAHNLNKSQAEELTKKVNVIVAQANKTKMLDTTSLDNLF